MIKLTNYDNSSVPATINTNSNTPSELFGIHNRDLQAAPLQAHPEGFDFWQIFAIVMRSKWTIVLMTLVGFAASYYYASTRTPLFKATATIELQKREAEIVQGSGVLPANIADSEFIATQLALLRSRSLATKVALDSSVNIPVGGQSAAQRHGAEVDTILSGITLDRVGGSRIIRVGFIHPDPAITAAVANGLSEKLISSNLERRFETTSYAREFLTERLAEAKVDLERSERRLVEYAGDKKILDIGSESTAGLAGDTLVFLNSKLAEAQSDVISATQELQAAGGGFIQGNFSQLNELISQKLNLKQEFDDKRTQFGDQFPAVVSLQARINGIDAAISSERERLFGILENKLDAARERETLLNARITELKGDVQDARRRRIDYTILGREVNTARSKYDALLQRMKQISMLGGVATSQISIVDRARVPTYPFSPNKPFIILFGLIGGFVMGAAIAFARYLIDDTIKTPDDVKIKLGMPCLGVIPKVKAGDNFIVDSMANPRSEISEAYFSTRTALSFATSNGTPKSLLVTSNQPEEGKTSSCVALGVAFAKAGSRVLVIDADMRKPSFVADAEKSIGLSGLLTTHTNLMDQVMVSEISKNLYLLPSGLIPPNPAELLSGPRVSEIIRSAEQLFDLVIVDAPPVLSFADAPVLASHCEATVLVVQSGSVRRPAVERSLLRLKASHSNLAGVILTHFDARKAGYSYNYYYYAYGKAAGEYGNRKQKSTVTHSGKKINLFYSEDQNSEEGGSLKVN